MRALSHPSLQLLLAAAVSSGFAGCGPDRPALSRVRGTVTFDGKPLDVGTVMFIPAKGHYAQGEIQKDGTYSLTTFDENDGALLGNHKVSITAVKAGADMAAVPVTPPRYSSEQTSGLEADVTDQPENTINFDLTTKPKRR